MLRVGDIVEIPLGYDTEGLEPERLAEVERANAPYVGKSVRVRLLHRFDAMAYAEEARLLGIEAVALAAGDDRKAQLAHARKVREALKPQIAAMVVGIPGQVVGGVDMAGIGGEEAAKLLDEAHDDLIFSQVAMRARAAQQPSRAAKNSSASSPSPIADASSTSAA